MKERVGDHDHQGMPVQADPGSAFEMVQPEFLLELLVRLLADPSGLDGGGERLEGSIGRQVRDIVFPLPGRAPLAQQPDLLAAGHALDPPVPHAMSMTIGEPDVPPDPALLAEMADFAGVAKAEAVELVPASEKASLYASLYGKLLSPTDGSFAEKIQAVLAANKDTYHEKITIMVEKYLKNC